MIELTEQEVATILSALLLWQEQERLPDWAEDCTTDLGKFPMMTKPEIDVLRGCIQRFGLAFERMKE